MNNFIFICVLLSAILSIPLLIIKNTNLEYGFVFKAASILIISLLILALFYWVSLFYPVPTVCRDGQTAAELLTDLQSYPVIEFGIKPYFPAEVIDFDIIPQPSFNQNFKLLILACLLYLTLLLLQI